MDALDQLRTVQSCAQAVIDKVKPSDHALETPCEGWDVAMLLDKMVTSGALFATLCRGEKPDPEVNLLFPTEIGRHNASAAFAAAAHDCEDAFVQSRLEGEMMGPLGVMVPKKAGIMVRMTDCTLNTWDLARSIGVSPGIDEAMLGPIVEFASGFLPKVREKTDHPRFGAPTVFEGDNQLDRLVAMSGRDPQWSAG